MHEQLHHWAAPERRQGPTWAGAASAAVAPAGAEAAWEGALPGVEGAEPGAGADACTWHQHGILSWAAWLHFPLTCSTESCTEGHSGSGNGQQPSGQGSTGVSPCITTGWATCAAMHLSTHTPCQLMLSTRDDLRVSGGRSSCCSSRSPGFDICGGRLLPGAGQGGRLLLRQKVLLQLEAAPPPGLVGHNTHSRRSACMRHRAANARRLQTSGRSLQE